MASHSSFASSLYTSILAEFSITQLVFFLTGSTNLNAKSEEQFWLVHRTPEKFVLFLNDSPKFTHEINSPKMWL